MISIINKLCCDNRGNAILEFVLVFPIFMGLILGTINIAILLNNDILAASAARAGGRTTAVTGSQEQGEAKAGELLKKTGFLPFKGDIRITKPGPGTKYITSEITYRVPVLVPGFASLLGGKPWDTEIELKEKNSYYVEYRHRTGG